MDEKLSVIVVDDEPSARTLLASYLKDHDDVVILAECSNGVEALPRIENLKPDAVFLDIQMPNLGGFELIQQLSEPLPCIVFVTAFDEYAIKAFEINALDYLLKPFDRERFEESLRRAREACRKRNTLAAKSKIKALLKALDDGRESYKSKLIVKEKNKSIFIPVDEIEFIEAFDNYVKIHTPKGIKLGSYSLKSVGQELDPTVFIRVHKSFIVNQTKIQAVEPFFHGEYILYFQHGEKVKLSRTYKDNLKMILGA